jgi:high-affinity K+ transport system ATPase subunit B
MAATQKARPLFDPPIVRQAIVDAFKKLSPLHQVRNPVMFTVLAGSVFATLLWVQALVGEGEAPAGFIFGVAAWLWFTELFANFAEAMAEGRGKAQAAALRATRQNVAAKKLREMPVDEGRPNFGALQGHHKAESVSASDLRLGDIVLVEAGDQVPADGEVVRGVPVFSTAQRRGINPDTNATGSGRATSRLMTNANSITPTSASITFSRTRYNCRAPSTKSNPATPTTTIHTRSDTPVTVSNAVLHAR